MVFSESIIKEAWQRAGGRCECERGLCGHNGRCGKQLEWNARGLESYGGWEAHHIIAGGVDTANNCEILCQGCHKNTRSYGI